MVVVHGTPVIHSYIRPRNLSAIIQFFMGWGHGGEDEVDYAGEEYN